MLGSEKGTRAEAIPTYFNDCVSNTELQKLIQYEETFIDGRRNDIIQTFTTLVKWVQDVDKQPEQPRNRHDAKLGDD